MKRIILACFLLTATLTLSTVQQTYAYAAPAAVTSAAFTTKVNTMDAQIAAGNITGATTTWNEIHDMMLSVLGATKENIRSAATPAAEAAARTVLNNQVSIYQTIWGLKTDLATNRAAIHTKLLEFAGTF